MKSKSEWQYFWFRGEFPPSYSADQHNPTDKFQLIFTVGIL